MSTLSTFCRYRASRARTNVGWRPIPLRMWNRGHFVSPLAKPRRGPRPLLAPLCLSPGCCCASGSPFPRSALLVLACLVPVSGRLRFGVGHNDRKRGRGRHSIAAAAVKMDLALCAVPVARVDIELASLRRLFSKAALFAKLNLQFAVAVQLIDARRVLALLMGIEQRSVLQVFILQHKR